MKTENMFSELVDEVFELGDLFFLSLSLSDGSNKLLGLSAFSKRVTVKFFPMIEDTLGESSS